VGEADNIVIQMLVENGIVGIVFMLGFTFSIWRLLKRLRSLIKTERDYWLVIGLEATVIAAVIHGMLEVTFIGLFYGILFWLMMGIAVSYKRMLEQ
jgi:O-antigen ligase